MSAASDMQEQATRWWNTVHQDEWWRTIDGTLVRIVEMEDDHRRNLMRWLEARAETIAFLAPLGADHPDDGDWDWDRALDTLLDETARDPIGWLRRTPLYMRLRELSPPRPAPTPVQLPHELEG